MAGCSRQQIALCTSLKSKPQGLKGITLLLSLCVLDNVSFPVCFVFLLTGYIRSLITNLLFGLYQCLSLLFLQYLADLQLKNRSGKQGEQRKKKCTQGIFSRVQMLQCFLSLRVLYLLIRRCNNAQPSHLYTYMDKSQVFFSFLVNFSCRGEENSSTK